MILNIILKYHGSKAKQSLLTQLFCLKRGHSIRLLTKITVER